jgi:hypothetical protein
MIDELMDDHEDVSKRNLYMSCDFGYDGCFSLN